MISISKEEILRLVSYADLIGLLNDAYANSSDGPTRFHVTIDQPPAPSGTLLLMPWWDASFLGVKLATVFPGNQTLKLPSVNASYLLSSSSTGQPLALLEGSTLTYLRTAATAGLASALLSKPDSSTLLMVGAGTLAVPIIQAHLQVRPISNLLIWNRTPENAERVKEEIRSVCDVEVVSELSRAIPMADIICCATLSTEPLVQGHLVNEGTHINLIGAYTPSMRESDTALLAKSRVFVDTLSGATKEAGDLIAALAEGSWSLSQIEGQLEDLCTQRVSGRKSDHEITVFKSVGSGLQDLVVAKLAYLKSIE